MTNIINVLEQPQIDTTIIKKEYHSYTPYLQSVENNDEIRIAIQNQVRVFYTLKDLLRRMIQPSLHP